MIIANCHVSSHYFRSIVAQEKFALFHCQKLLRSPIRWSIWNMWNMYAYIHWQPPRNIHYSKTVKTHTKKKTKKTRNRKSSEKVAGSRKKNFGAGNFSPDSERWNGDGNGNQSLSGNWRQRERRRQGRNGGKKEEKRLIFAINERRYS